MLPFVFDTYCMRLEYLCSCETEKGGANACREKG